jgi:hypothetical protein
MDDVFSGAELDDGLSGDLHMAAHADLMFESGDGGAVFRLEEVEIGVEDILIEELGQSVVFAFEVGDAGLEVGLLVFETGRMCSILERSLGVGFSAAAICGVSFSSSSMRSSSRSSRLVMIFRRPRFRGQGGVFFIPSRLQLLLFVAGDGISLSACFHLKFALFDLDFLGAGFGLPESSGGVRDLFFARLAFFGRW